MKDSDLFNFLKGLFYGLDYNSDTQYQKSLQEIINRQDISEDYKIYLISNLNTMYYRQKECLRNGKQVVDFSECIYNLMYNPSKE